MAEGKFNGNVVFLIFFATCSCHVYENKCVTNVVKDPKQIRTRICKMWAYRTQLNEFLTSCKRFSI